MRDINRYTKRHATDWKDIGLELGLQFEILNIIEKDHSPCCVTCFQSMINCWLNSATENATWEALEVALTNVNRQKLGFDPVDDVYGMEIQVCAYSSILITTYVASLCKKSTHIWRCGTKG